MDIYERNLMAQPVAPDVIYTLQQVTYCDIERGVGPILPFSTERIYWLVRHRLLAKPVRSWPADGGPSIVGWCGSDLMAFLECPVVSSIRAATLRSQEIVLDGLYSMDQIDRWFGEDFFPLLFWSALHKLYQPISYCGWLFWYGKDLQAMWDAVTIEGLEEIMRDRQY